VSFRQSCRALPEGHGKPDPEDLVTATEPGFFTDRWSATSWWRSARFSAAKAARGTTSVLTSAARTLKMLIRGRLDLKAPKLPVVIGEFTGPWGADCKEAAALAIRKAQRDAAARPEFARTVKFVETHDPVRTDKDSPTKEDSTSSGMGRRTSSSAMPWAKR